jgi:hypothetical protein
VDIFNADEPVFTVCHRRPRHSWQRSRDYGEQKRAQCATVDVDSESGSLDQFLIRLRQVEIEIQFDQKPEKSTYRQLRGCRTREGRMAG